MVLGFHQGASENQQICDRLLADLASRGLELHQGFLAILDGGRGLRAAVKKHCGEKLLVQRCVLHIAGRDPRFQRGGTSPPGQVPASPVAWGQTWWGNLLCRSRPDT